jgi:major membrane immunogen (membrane-anchored lipoprotein)
MGTLETPRRPAIVLSFATLGLLLVVGCGDSTGLPKRYPVSGKVTYNGEPVKSGTIVFEPSDISSGRFGNGTIEDGYYKLSTSGEGPDGALPGDYKIIIISKSVDMAQVEANRKGGAGRQDDVFKAEKKAKSNVPQKYARSDTSGLTAKVEEKSNTFDFTLTD